MSDFLSTKKHRGRPATGVGTPVHVRCSEEFLEKLDFWRHEQASTMNRSEAIRHLVEHGVAQKPDLVVTWNNPATKQDEVIVIEVKKFSGNEIDAANTVATVLSANPNFKVVKIKKMK